MMLPAARFLSHASNVSRFSGRASLQQVRRKADVAKGGVEKLGVNNFLELFDKRFVDFNTRFVDFNTRFVDFNTRLDEFNNRIVEFRSRMVSYDRQLLAVVGLLSTAFYFNQTALQNSIQELRSEMKNDLDKNRSEMKNDVKNLEGNLNKHLDKNRSEMKNDLDKKLAEGFAKGFKALTEDLHEFMRENSRHSADDLKKYPTTASSP